VNNQHVASSNPYEWWATTFKSNVERIGRTLLILAPVFDPVPLTRAWCLFEIHATASTGCELLVEMPPEEAATFEEAFVYKFETISSALGRIDLARAESFSATDKANIHQTVSENVGFHALNVQVMAKLRRWLRAAAEGSLRTAEAKVRAALGADGRRPPRDLDAAPAAAGPGPDGRAAALASSSSRSNFCRRPRHRHRRRRRHRRRPCPRHAGTRSCPPPPTSHPRHSSRSYSSYSSSSSRSRSRWHSSSSSSSSLCP
jgi:hypothetical protein